MDPIGFLICPVYPLVGLKVVFESWHRISCNNIDAIKTVIVTYGVVDMAVYVGRAFNAYSGGICQDLRNSCNANLYYYTITNHAVVLVGWDDNADVVPNATWSDSVDVHVQ